eukprot:500092-Pelagomonas_calceolata.AAC.8
MAGCHMGNKKDGRCVAWATKKMAGNKWMDDRCVLSVTQKKQAIDLNYSRVQNKLPKEYPLLRGTNKGG